MGLVTIDDGYASILRVRYLKYVLYFKYFDIIMLFIGYSCIYFLATIEGEQGE